MARIIVAELFASLDLVVEAPEKWHFPWVGDEMIAEISGQQGESSALLMGRRTYDIFAGSWPDRGDEVPLASQLNAMKKFVVTSATEAPTWNNTQAVRFDDLAALKREGEGRIAVAGSIDLVESLLAAGLLDELRLLIHPVVLGTGRRLFDGYSAQRVDLQLTESRALEHGVQLTVHRPSAARTGAAS